MGLAAERCQGSTGSSLKMQWVAEEMRPRLVMRWNQKHLDSEQLACSVWTHQTCYLAPHHLCIAYSTPVSASALNCSTPEYMQLNSSQTYIDIVFDLVVRQQCAAQSDTLQANHRLEQTGLGLAAVTMLWDIPQSNDWQDLSANKAWKWQLSLCNEASYSLMTCPT